jgi:hypothetical protein
LCPARLPQTPQFVQHHVQPKPRDELHDVVVQAVLLADAEHRHDVGVVQLRCRSRFALEAAQVARVEQGVRGQHLDGDVPAKGELLSLVDDAHAAATHLPQDLVVPQLLHGRRGGRACGLSVLTRRVVRGLGLFHQHQRGQHLADVVRVLGVASGELLDRGTFPLPERFHEFVRDLPERVCGGRVVVDHPPDLLVEPGNCDFIYGCSPPSPMGPRRIGSIPWLP